MIKKQSLFASLQKDIPEDPFFNDDRKRNLK